MDRNLGFTVLNKTSSSTNPLNNVMPNHPVQVVFLFWIQPNQPKLGFKHRPSLHHISNFKNMACENKHGSYHTDSRNALVVCWITPSTEVEQRKVL
jgi:ABC-type maltose transport system permease subunit